MLILHKRHPTRTKDSCFTAHPVETGGVFTNRGGGTCLGPLGPPRRGRPECRGGVSGIRQVHVPYFEWDLDPNQHGVTLTISLPSGVNISTIYLGDGVLSRCPDGLRGRGDDTLSCSSWWSSSGTWYLSGRVKQKESIECSTVCVLFPEGTPRKSRSEPDTTRGQNSIQGFQRLKRESKVLDLRELRT